MKKPGLLILIVSPLLAAGCGKPQTVAAPAASPPTQVVAFAAQLDRVEENLSLVGSLLADEIVDIKPEIEGVIQEIKFEEGQPVKRGQLLVHLDDSKLAASVAEAESSFKLSESTFERTKLLFAKSLVSQQEHDQAASVFEVNRATLALKQRQLKDTRIYAPFDGLTSSRRVSPGQVIGKDTILTTLVAADPVKVEINVPERFLGQVKIGLALELTVAAHPGRKFRGEVYFITPAIDPTTRTALVKARIPNAQLDLKPGMFANLDLTLQIRDHAVVVPETSVAQLLEGGNAMLFVIDGKGTAQLRPVRLGVAMAGRVEITSGLAPGEMVITEGLQKIGPGAPVKVAAAKQP